MKTNSEYSAMINPGAKKNNYFTAQDMQSGRPTEGKSPQKLPKPQEREKKSSGSDLDEVDYANMDEFVVNENYNIQKLKNPSLITSIANTKPLDLLGVNLA